MMTNEEDTSWTKLPEYLEPYRGYLETEGYPPLDELMEVFLTDPDIRSHYSDEYFMQCITVFGKISLLRDLHRDKKLRDLSAWVCKTPNPEDKNFCGGPRNGHPDIWGCGYQIVD